MLVGNTWIEDKERVISVEEGRELGTSKGVPYFDVNVLIEENVKACFIELVRLAETMVPSFKKGKCILM